MPGEYQCGNCNSKSTVSYLPPCCVSSALEDLWKLYKTDLYKEEAIREMLEETIAVDCADHQKAMLNEQSASLKEGMRQAYEDSAKIAESRITENVLGVPSEFTKGYASGQDNTAEGIAKEIRAKAKEMK